MMAIRPFPARILIAAITMAAAGWLVVGTPAVGRGQAPGGGPLKLANVRLSIGELGAPRPDHRFLPGDIVFISYDIVGLTIASDGTAKYRMAMEVSDTTGKVYFKENPREMTDFVPLRGDTLPARAFVTIGLDQPPGRYICKVTVTDPATQATATFSAPFEVLKPDFGIVALYPTLDPQRQIAAPATLVVGQTLFVNLSIVGFQRDPKTRQPHVQTEYQLLDGSGRPLLDKPITQVQNQGVDEAVPLYTLQFPLFLNRPGKFRLRITATDKVAGSKTSQVELPIIVIAAQ